MENDVTTFSPYEQYWEHLKTDRGLIRIVIHVNAEDHAWFSESLCRKSINAYLVRFALREAAKRNKEENEEVTVHYHRAKAKEAPGLTVRWQLAAYWKTTPVHHHLLSRSPQGTCQAYEILPDALHAYVEPFHPELSAAITGPPRFSHFVPNYDKETRIQDYFTAAAS